MRLLIYDSSDNLYITRDLADSEVKPYAILSHTWGKDEEEVTFHEIGSTPSQQKPGYRKIEFCGKQARQDGRRDGWQHFWVDTCCINKANHTELSKAITSMYRWYEQSQVCYVYLIDVSSQPTPTGQDWRASFRQSRWFRRGWTLQELLAPRHVVFYSKEWERLGTKEELKVLLHEITCIPTAALEGQPLFQFPIIERMRWTQGRQTKEQEDQAYCLLGIFGVYMYLNYGEGDNAFRRLQKKLDTQSQETSIQGSGQSTSLHFDLRQIHNTSSGQQVVNKHMSGVQNFNLVTEPVHDYDFREPVGLCLTWAPHMEREFFIGRGREFEDMEKILLPDDATKDQRRLVLGGMGGIGKTQLALVYAQRHAQHYDSVFWLNATSEGTLMSSFQAIAKRIFSVKAYQAIDPRHSWDYVHSWLSHPQNKGWLLIFDNYDEPQAYDIRSFYPDTAYGTIIVTTRRPGLVVGNKISVKPLQNLDEGIQILQTRSGRDNINDDIGASRLATRLAGLPLALATAGAFLGKSTWTFQQYLDAYERQWDIVAQTPLSIEYQDRALCTTWELSYDQLVQEHPNAARLLKQLAYFDHQAVWYDLLQAGIRDDLPDWILYIANDSIRFESTIHVLIDYCFIETQITSRTYSMHTCVHDWTMAGLNRTLEPWSYWFAFHCVASSIKDEDRNSFGHVRYAKFTPHAVRLMTAKFTVIRHDLSEADVEAAEDITKLLQSQVQLSSANLLLAKVLTVKEKVLGVEHTSTLDTVNNLGLLYCDQGKLGEAEEMYVRALAGYEKALGPEHTLTFNTVHNLGNLYYHQGKLAEAEEIYIRALAGREKALGAEHTSTLNTVNNLGLVYYNQGKLAEAEEMYMRALAGKEKALGAEHTSTLDTVNNLGLFYSNQGKLAEAEEMYIRALAGYEKALGLEHTSTLNTVNNLGLLYYYQGKLAEAEEMYVRALTGYKKALGAEHTSTLHTANNLGLLYSDQGKLAEAEEMYVRVLAGHEKALGAEHTSTLHTVHNLGLLYYDQGKLAEAEEMYIRALAGKEKALGAEHTSTLDTVNNLGLLYCSQGKLAEAEEMYEQALAGYEKALGPENTSTLNTVHNLGSLYYDQGKLAEAEEMYVRALAGHEKALGAEHTSTLHTVNNLGLLYRDQGKLAEAEKMYVRALAGYEKALGAEHTSTLHAVHNLGLLYSDQGKLAEAEEMYEQALAGYEKALGADHTSTLLTVHNLGSLYRDQGKLVEAEEMYVRALAGCEKALGAEHTSTLQTVHNLGVLYSDQGKLAEAEQMYERALVGYRKVLNEEHPDRLNQMLDYADLFVSRLELKKATQTYQQIIDICAHHLPSTRSRAQLMVDIYAKALSKMTGMLDTTSTDAQPYLQSLVKYLRQEDQITVLMTQYLAKALLHLKDDGNVRQTLFQCVAYGSGQKLDLGGTRCDACHRRLDTDKGMNVCRQCVDTNLCDLCLSGKQDHRLVILKCQHTQFYNFGGTIRQALQSSESRNLIERNTWLDKLSQKYRAY